MPEPERLTKDQQEAIRNWLSRPPGNQARCPWCGAQNFSIGSDLAAAPLLTISENTSNLDLRRQYPLAVLICDTCAHVHFFAAMRITGLYPTKAEEAKVSDG